MDKAKSKFFSERQRENFGHPSDLSEFADVYEVLTGKLDTSAKFYVCDISRSGITPIELHEKLTQDMKKRVKGQPNGGKSEGCQELQVTDYTDLALVGLKEFSGTESCDSIARQYHIVTKTPSGEVISYTCATVFLGFMADGFDQGEESASRILSWIERAKGCAIDLYATVILDNAYTLSKHRGVGASSATIAYLRYVLHTTLSRTLSVLGPCLAHAQNSLNLSLCAHAEFHSKSGHKVFDHLHGELEEMVAFLKEEVDEQKFPITIEEEVGYDAGY